MSLCVETLTSVAENKTATLRYQIQDGQNNDIPASVLTTLTLTFFDVHTGNIINNRQNQDHSSVTGL